MKLISLAILLLFSTMGFAQLKINEIMTNKFSKFLANKTDVTRQNINNIVKKK